MQVIIVRSTSYFAQSYALTKTVINGHLDGLPGEFYKVFFPLVGEYLVDLYNESISKGELCESQKRSVLSLIFKKGDRCLLKNYRPISLSTTDYKILAHILAS